MKIGTLFIVAALALLLAFGRAASAAEPLLSAIVGTGGNTSYLTLDFRGGPGVAQTSYAFAYRYDGAKTGGDFLDALVGANVGFSTGATSFPPFGRFFTAFGYAENLLDTDSTPGGDDYWAFWDGPDGAAWNSTQTGPDDFALVNNGYIGFSYAPQFPSDYRPFTPQASTAVPEPSTLVLGLLGITTALGLTRCRRRRRAAPCPATRPGGGPGRGVR